MHLYRGCSLTLKGAALIILLLFFSCSIGGLEDIVPYSYKGLVDEVS